MQHHSWKRTPLALPATRTLARRLRNHAHPLKVQLRPSVTPAKPVVLHQMLVEVLDREARIALAIEPLHFLRPVARNTPARRLAPTVEQTRLAVLLVAPRPTPERTLGNA